MKLEGSIHVIVESRRKKGAEGALPMGISMSSLGPKDPVMPNLETTPIKSNQNSI